MNKRRAIISCAVLLFCSVVQAAGFPKLPPYSQWDQSTPTYQCGIPIILKTRFVKKGDWILEAWHAFFWRDSTIPFEIWREPGDPTKQWEYWLDLTSTGRNVEYFPTRDAFLKAHPDFCAEVRRKK